MSKMISLKTIEIILYFYKKEQQNHSKKTGNGPH